MSYAVCHMQKIKMGGVKGVQNHTDRLRESRTNPDIDYSRSHLNKKLDQQPTEKTYYNRIRDRIKELDLPRAVRKDAVTMCGFICTSDKSFFEKMPQSEQDRYFKESFEFLKERYGAKNVVSCTIHYDETTPHMHYYMVPVTPDGRLSAKDIFTPKELKSLQTDYYNFLNKKGFGVERGQPSDRRHLDVQEFKEKTGFYEQKKQELQAISQGLQAQAGKLNNDKTKIEERREILQDQQNKLSKAAQLIDEQRQELAAKERAVLEKEKDLAVRSYTELENIPVEKAAFGKVKLSEQDFKKMDKAAKDGYRAMEKLNMAEDELSDAKKIMKRYSALDIEKYELSKELQTTKIRLNQAEGYIQAIGHREAYEQQIQRPPKIIDGPVR